MESFQREECLQLAWWGREFLSRGEQNTHLHKLAFQMGMSLMQDLTGTERLLGGKVWGGATLRPGQRVKVLARGWLPPGPTQPLSSTLLGKLTAFVGRTTERTKGLWSPAHIDSEDG